MAIKLIKVTKKDRVCYASVPEFVEHGDKLELLEVSEMSVAPQGSIISVPQPAGVRSLSRTPMLFVKVNDSFQRILMKHILYVEAGGSYCSLHVSGMPSILVSAPLAKVARHLDEEYFIRVHRSFMVNKLHIEAIAGNTLKIGRVAIPISKFMKKEVLGRLNMLSFSK